MSGFLFAAFMATIVANALDWRESKLRLSNVNPALTLIRRVFPALFLCGLAACQDAGQGSVEEEYVASAARGRAFAQVNCSTCHAIDATGQSPYAPAPPFRTLSENYPVENLAEALAEGIGVGHSGEVQMPEYVLNPEQIDDFLSYLEALSD